MRVRKLVVQAGLLTVATTNHPDTVGRQTGNPSFLNNINIETVGNLSIRSAYLSDKAGNLVPPKNLVQPGEAVYLTLLVSKGWTAIKGRIHIGASQTILTDIGEPVLASGDLFAGRQEIPEKEGEHLQLQTIITNSRSSIRHFVVQFRLWDKRGNASASGSYRLYLHN